MRLSRTAAAPARSARSSLRSRAVVNTGVSSSSPSDDARVPGRDRPAAVHRLRRAAVERALGERRERQPETGADEDLRRHRPPPRRAGEHAERGEPAGDEDDARTPRACAGLPMRGRDAAGRDRGDRHHRHDRRRRRRDPSASRRRGAARAGTAPPSARPRAAAARGSRRRSAVRPARRPAGRAAASTPTSVSERERRLDEEDRLPAERLGQDPADRRAERRAERSRRSPRCARRARPSPAISVSRSSAAQTSSAPPTA